MTVAITLQSYEVEEVKDALLEFKRMLGEAGYAPDDDVCVLVDNALAIFGYAPEATDDE